MLALKRQKIMASKKKLFKKLRILLTQEFDTPKAAFEFFDKNGDGKLERRELKSLIKSAGASGFISGIASKKMIKGLDEDGNKALSWSEFKKAVDTLLSK